MDKSAKGMLLIPKDDLPKHVLCFGIKTPTETLVVHKKDAKKW
jgi:hypothetical protein